MHCFFQFSLIIMSVYQEYVENDSAQEVCITLLSVFSDKCFLHDIMGGKMMGTATHVKKRTELLHEM